MPHRYPLGPDKKEIMADNQGNQNMHHTSRTKQLSRAIGDHFESTVANQTTKKN